VSWPTVALGDVAEVRQGGRLGLTGNHFVPVGTPAYGAGGMNGYLETTEFNRPAVILSAIGARCGKCFYVEGAWTSLANTQLIFPANDKLDPKFLWYAINGEKKWLRHGTSQPYIKPSTVKSQSIPLPPLPEQKRIAAILDKADAIRARRRKALSEADALLRATFLDLFGDPVANPKGWETAAIGDLIADGPQNGLYRHSSDYGSGTRILRIDSFYDGRTRDLSSLKRVRIDEDTISRWALRPDDVVINRVNSIEYLGKSAIIPPLSEPTVFESNMMRLTADRSRIEPGFMIDQLQTAYVRRQIRKLARPAVNQSSINQEDVKSIMLRVPPLPLQQRYIGAVKNIGLFGAVVGAALTESDALYASLAQRAFRGEL